jgi:hypothetical protein
MLFTARVERRSCPTLTATSLLLTTRTTLPATIQSVLIDKRQGCLLSLCWNRQRTLFPHSLIAPSRNSPPLPQQREQRSVAALHEHPTFRVLRDLMMRILHLRRNCAAVDLKAGISLAQVLVRFIPCRELFQPPCTLSFHPIELALRKRIHTFTSASRTRCLLSHSVSPYSWSLISTLFTLSAHRLHLPSSLHCIDSLC